jgi:thioredoxin 2
MAAERTVIVCPKCGKKNRVPAAATGTPRCGNCQATLPWIAEASDGTYAEVVQRSQLPVLVDLWAPWCGPCKMVSPSLENLAREYAGRVKLVKVNVDESPLVSGGAGVQGIPTLLVVADGDVVARQVGAAPEHALRTWLDEALSAPR